MLAKDQSVNLLLGEKRFKFLRNAIQLIEEVSSKKNNSSELLARYNSRFNSSDPDFDKDTQNEFYFNYQKKEWKKFSAKERRLLFNLFLLSKHTPFEEDLLRTCLRSNSDRNSQLWLETTNVERLIEDLKSLSKEEVRFLARMTESTLKSLQKKSTSLSLLFEIQIFQVPKKKPRKLVRHKGYRDHGSLGVDSIGLTLEQLKKLLSKEETIYYEAEGFTQNDLYADFSSPAFFVNIWNFD